LVTALAAATGAANADLPGFRHYGSTIGASVSSTFLLLIGVLNLLVLADLLRAWRESKRGRPDQGGLERRLLDRGLLSRVFLRRFGDRIDASWKMYRLGALFGLGFDTAAEIALIATAAGAARP